MNLIEGKGKTNYKRVQEKHSDKNQIIKKAWKKIWIMKWMAEKRTEGMQHKN